MSITITPTVKRIVLNAKNNWRSGLTVALVAIPLSISLAVASGATPTMGIITAIWAGLFAAIFGGSNYNVVGPTGALSGLIATYVALHGIDFVSSLTMLTGGIILIAYLLKLERYLFFIPSSVVHGFTLGVAGIIGLNQLNFALGLSDLPKHERFFLNVVESFRHIAESSETTVMLFVTFLLLLFLLKRYFPKVPGALILSPFGIVFGYAATSGILPWTVATLGSVFGAIPFELMHIPRIAIHEDMVLPAVAIALVAILETMLSAKIADHMTHTRHSERNEMFGLSLANLASGLAGGIPATAALARTALNVKTGATDRASSFLSSVFLAFIAFFLLTYFRYIPMAVIAAILVFVAIQMVELQHYKKMYHSGREGYWIALSVAIVTLYKDPIVGIIFGTALSLFLLVEKISRGQFDIKLRSHNNELVQSITGDRLDTVSEHADILVYSFKGKLAYLNSHAHVKRFEESLSRYAVVILRLRSVYYIDLDGAEALDEIIDLIRLEGREVCLTSLNPAVTELLEQVSAPYAELKERGLIFQTSSDAIAHYSAVT